MNKRDNMKFEELTRSEYLQFVTSQEQDNFLQSIEMYDRYQKEGIESYLIGVKDKKKVIAATLLVATHSRLGKLMNANKGFILDYQNKELVSFMTEETKKFVKEKKGILLYIDPYIVSESRDTDGRVTGEIDNTEVKTDLESIGYKYLGQTSQVKWSYVLDLEGKTKEELWKNLKGNHRNLITKGQTKYKNRILKLTKEELPRFKKITESTAQRHGVNDRPLSYYLHMMDAFQDKVVFLLCEMNKEDMLPIAKEEVASIQEKLEKTNNENKKRVYQEELEIAQKELERIASLPEGIIDTSAAMFMLYGNEIVYLFSGSIEEYKRYNGAYNIQWEIIQYGVEHHFKRYNFYGINLEQKDGVYKFKKGFNGYVEETLGCFAIPTSWKGKLHLMMKREYKMYHARKN